MTQYQATVLVCNHHMGAGEHYRHPMTECSMETCSFRKFVELTVNAEDGFKALEEVFKIGNREGQDIWNRTWPQEARSISVGDRVVLSKTETIVKTFECLALGWRTES